MFKSAISVDILQNAIKAIAAIIDECTLNITPYGLTARAVDPSNSAMCSIDLPSSVFTEFAGEECELGIDLNRFVEILAMADKNGIVNLGLDEHTHKLGIEMGGLSYNLALLDPSTMRKAPAIPQLELPAHITLSSVEFRRMVKAAAMTADHLRIGVDGDTFFMLAKGDTDSVRLELTQSELIDLKAADVSALYSLDYLSDMAKGVGTASEIVINLGRDLPVVVNFESAEDCPVVYILAPRIESD